MDRGMLIRIAADTETLKKNLAEGKNQIETTTAAMKKLAASLEGNKLIQNAHNIVAAVKELGGATKLTEAEKQRLNATLTKALEKYKALGKEAPDAMRQLHKETTAQVGVLDRIKGALGPLGTAMVAAFSVSAIIGFGKKILDTAGQIADLSARLGVSTDAVQKWKLAFEPAGISIDTVARSAAELANRVAGGDKSAAAVLKQLGLSAAELQRMNMEEMFNTVADAVGGLQNKAEQIYASKTLFGKGGVDLLAGLDGQLRETTKSFEDMGLIMDEGTVKAADDFGDKLGLLGTQMMALAAKALAPLLPLLSFLLDALMRVAGVIGSVVSPAIRFVQENLLRLGAGIDRFLAGVLDAAQKIPLLGKHLGFAAGAADWLRKDAAAADAALAKLRQSTDGAGKAAAGAAPPVHSFGKENEEAAKKAEQHAKQLADLRKELTGGGAIEKVNQLREAFAGSIPIHKMTEDAQRRVRDVLIEATAAWKAQGVAVPAWVNQQLAAVVQLKQFREELEKLQRPPADGGISAIANNEGALALQREMEYGARVIEITQRVTEARRAAAVAARDLDFRRAEFAIAQAVREGASWRDVYAMEARLSHDKMRAAVADADREFREKVDALQRTGKLTQAEYDAMAEAHGILVSGMEEEWRLAEAAKRDELRRTHDVWFRSWEGLKQTVRDVQGAIAAAFGAMVLEGRSFKDAFVEVWRSLKQSVMSIFSDVLNAFVNSFLKGMLGALMGHRGAFSSAFSGLFGGLLPGGPSIGGGGLLGMLGRIPGLGGLFGGGAAAGTSALALAPGLTAGLNAQIGMAGAAGAGGGLMGGLGALMTNPWTIGIAAAAVGLPALLGGFKKGGFINNLFGGPSKQELEGRGAADEFTEAVSAALTETQRLEAATLAVNGNSREWADSIVAIKDAYLATGRTVDQALDARRRLYEAEKHGAEAVKRVTAEIGAVFEEQRADAVRLEAAVQKYGFSVQELGPKFEQQRLSEQARELIEDWRVLIGSGIELDAVNGKMAESIGAYFQAAIRGGIEVPIAMRPILQSLADQGKLVDANGNAITDLEATGVTFSETMTEGFDRIVVKLQQVIDTLQGAGQAIDDIPRNVVIDVEARLRTDAIDAYVANLPNVFGIADRIRDRLINDPAADVPGFVSGTMGQFVDFGPQGTLVKLHGRERVMTEAEGQREAAGGVVLDFSNARFELRDVGTTDPTAHARQVIGAMFRIISGNEIVDGTGARTTLRKLAAKPA